MQNLLWRLPPRPIPQSNTTLLTLGSNQTGLEIVISRLCPSLEHARGDPDLWFAAASVCRY